MSDDTIYRSSHSDILAAWEQAQETWRAYVAQRAAQVEAWGFTDRPMYVTRSVFGDRVAGFGYLTGEQQAPDGWRRERGKAWMAPARTTPRGKVIGREFDAVAQVPNLRRSFERFGMPTTLSVGGLRITTYEAELYDDAVWVRWHDAEPSSEPPAEFWERVKLSEFYAMVESGVNPFPPDQEDA